MPFYRNAHIHLHIRLIFGNQVNQKLLFPRRLRQQHKKYTNYSLTKCVLVPLIVLPILVQ